MAHDTGRLNGRQHSFVAALTAGLTIIDAAKTVGVAPRTAYRWAGLPKVRIALREAQDEALGGVARRLTTDARYMLDVLVELAQNPEMPPAVRVSAARIWLDGTFKAKQVIDLTVRVAELEEQLDREMNK